MLMLLIHNNQPKIVKKSAKKIEKTDMGTGRLIYRLYGITEEERKVIEG